MSITPKPPDEHVPVIDKLVADKVVETAVATQTALSTDNEALRHATELVAQRLREADERAERREDKRESREFWGRMVALFLGTITTLAAAWAGFKSQETHTAVNSRLDQVIERVEKASYAEGLLKGKEE